MRAWWFPDTTVLCNFAAVDRLRLLEKTLAGRGRWTEAVAYETSRSARRLPRLDDVLAGGWLDDPIEVSEPGEIDDIERLRRAAFFGAADRPLQHLGEAQTCYVIEHWAGYRGSVWVTDDRSAFDFARRRGIAARQTFDVVRHAVREALLPAGDGYRLLYRMVEAGRRLHRLPATPADLE